MVTRDWEPERYGRFRDLRLRPALELLAQVPDLPEGGVVDLGCGAGAVGPALAGLGRELVGVDNSSAMLAEAAKTGVYTDLIEADVTGWQGAAALIFSNAVLHWVGGHEALFSRLAGMLVPGGVLAVQMPRQGGAPSHRFIRDIAVSLFGNRFDDIAKSPVVSAVTYAEMLAGLGRVEAWESEYVQRLPAQESGHPVRAFTQSTAMRPYLERLDAVETEAFLAAYDTALGAAYTVLPDGGALMPFRRVFFTLQT